jgi:UDP-N-acetylmuramoyl-tripeptide--D-alanyl-D-alanine ligase
MGVSIDSRTVKKGDLFVALAGPNFDGHDFIQEAIASGAAAAVASRRPAALSAEAPLLMVSDTMAALEALGRAARSRSAARFAAVTGSVGKTGTKEALRLVLSTDGPTAASEGNLNNQWGAPLSLARMPRDAHYGVFELGMNHAGEIAPLSRLVRPHVAVITTVEPAHLEFFASVEAIADAKAEIFLGLEAGGAAVLNRDSPQFDRLARAARDAKVGRIVSFGEHAGADARLVDCALQPDSSTVHARILGHDVTYKLGAPGRHLVMNSLAVLAAAEIAGADLALAVLALAGLQPAAGRGTRITLEWPDGKALLIDESYNANPASMRAALALLGQADVGPRGRRIAVLGDMLELGPQGAALHAALAENIVEDDIDLVYCCGPLMRALWEALPSGRRGGYAEASAALEPQVLAALQPGDTLMVKGSNGSRMGPIVKALESRFNRTAASAAAQG